MIRPRPRRAMEGETVFAGTSAKPSVGEGFYPSRRFCIMFRAGQSPAPTLSLRGRIAPVAIRVLCLPLRGRWREAPEGEIVCFSFSPPVSASRCQPPPRGGREITPLLLFPLPLTSATAEPTAPTFQDKRVFQSRPSAATYLCRFAAKARFDNRPSPGGYFQKGRAAALPLWSFQGWGIFKGEGKSKSLPP